MKPVDVINTITNLEADEIKELADIRSAENIDDKTFDKLYARTRYHIQHSFETGWNTCCDFLLSWFDDMKATIVEENNPGILTLDQLIRTIRKFKLGDNEENEE